MLTKEEQADFEAMTPAELVKRLEREGWTAKARSIPALEPLPWELDTSGHRPKRAEAALQAWLAVDSDRPAQLIKYLVHEGRTIG